MNNAIREKSKQNDNSKQPNIRAVLLSHVKCKHQRRALEYLSRELCSTFAVIAIKSMCTGTNQNVIFFYVS